MIRIPPLVIAFLKSPYALCALLFFGNVVVVLIKGMFLPLPKPVRQTRECYHQHTISGEDDNQFFRRMWSSLNLVVHKCLAEKFQLRVVQFGWDTTTMNWLHWLVDEYDHKCNVVFIMNTSSLDLEREFKRSLVKCVIYSVHKDHEEPKHYRDPRYSIMTFPFTLNPYPRSVLMGSYLPRDESSIDLVYLLRAQVHKQRYDSINVYVDGKEHIKSLFTRSPFDDASLITCQMNVIYERPKSRLQRREFRNIWKRLLYDRRYLVISVRKINADKMHFHIINVSDAYCWAKYVSNFPFEANNI